MLNKIKPALIIGLVALITILQYSTDLSEHRHHILYQGLFFIPIMLAGFWFGLRSVLATSIGITLLLIPFTYFHWSGIAGDFNNVMEMILYNGVAVILGVLKDRERKQEKHAREVERLATMGQSVSGLAHDMKTSLIAIGGFSRLIRKRGHCPDHVDDCMEELDVIIAEAKRLETMTENMLDFARPLELNCTREDITRIVKQSIQIVSESKKEKSVRIETEFSTRFTDVFADPVRMNQVLINLLQNAVEASPDGETVTVVIGGTRRQMVISVRDQGCGLPEGHKEKIFSPFFTTKEKGTGLGLPIAEKIIEAHGGYLEVLENHGRGVTFQIVLPLRKIA
jgi:signal transduction histidine kinase